MARILSSPLAQNDLLDIWDYIAEESSTSIADAFIARIYGALEVAASTPHVASEYSRMAGGQGFGDGR